MAALRLAAALCAALLLAVSFGAPATRATSTCAAEANCTGCVALNAPTVGCGWCNVSKLCIVVVANGPGNYSGSCVEAFAVDAESCGPTPPAPSPPSETQQVKNWLKRNELWLIIASLSLCCCCTLLCVWKCCSDRRAKTKSASQNVSGKNMDASKKAADKKRDALRAIANGGSAAKPAAAATPSNHIDLVTTDAMIADMYGGDVDHAI